MRTGRGCCTRRGILLAGIVIGLCAGVGAPALAHGVLVRSTPSADAVLPTAPEQVVLRFNEPIDPGFSAATVFDADGRRVLDHSTISEDRRQISLEASALSRGTFAVRWRVLSAIDGHVTTGTFAFAVGQALALGEAPAAGSAGSARAVARGMALLAAVVLAGASIFRAVVLPAIRAPSLAAVTRVAALALVFGTVAELVLQAAALFDLPIGAVAADGRVATFILETQVGWGAVARAALACVLAVLAAGRTRALTWLSVAAAGGVLMSITAASHAAGTGLWAAAADLGHLVAAAAWIGGLVALLVITLATRSGDRRALLAMLGPRFSVIAAVGLAVVVVTGVINARALVTDVAPAVDSAYGRTLAVKLMMVVPLVVLGALNRRRWRSFVPLAAGEVTIAVAVVLAAAVLTVTPPGGSAAAAKADRPLLSGIAEDVSIRLAVTPALPGWNRMEASATLADGAPVGEPARIVIRALKLDEDIAGGTVVLVSQGMGRYAADTGDLGAPGFWEVEVVVRRPGRLDVSATFPMRLGEAPLCTPDPEAVRLLDRARAAWRAVRTWRETQQLTDGAGNVYLTWVEAEAPDRQRFRTSSGVEVVALGAVRYQKTGSSPWKRYEFSSPVPVEGPLYYMRDARGATRGRAGHCGDEPCQVVLWMSPDAGAEFAAWIGLRTHLVHRLLMLEPTHYMTLRYADFNLPIRILSPD
jgi:copper transport protein